MVYLPTFTPNSYPNVGKYTIHWASGIMIEIWLDLWLGTQRYLNIWVFPKLGIPPNHLNFNRVFHYFHHPFWGKHPYFLETSIWCQGTNHPIIIQCFTSKRLPESPRSLTQQKPLIFMTALENYWTPFGVLRRAQGSMLAIIFYDFQFFNCELFNFRGVGPGVSSNHKGSPTKV